MIGQRRLIATNPSIISSIRDSEFGGLMGGRQEPVMGAGIGEA
jgi:hypothetical protein